MRVNKQMKNVEYEHENNNNYMIIDSAKEKQGDSYQQKMLEKNSIDGLLDMSVKDINNNIKYYYNITSKHKMTQIYEVSKIGYSDVKNIINSLSFVMEQIRNYMLDIDCIVLEPEYIYINVNTKRAEFTYYPDESCDFAIGLKVLFEYILEKYDHNCAKRELMQVYNIYQKIVQGQYDINNLVELLADDLNLASKENVRDNNSECQNNITYFAAYTDNTGNPDEEAHDLSENKRLQENYSNRKQDCCERYGDVNQKLHVDKMHSECKNDKNYFRIINIVKLILMITAAYMVISLFIREIAIVQLGLYATIAIALVLTVISGYLDRLVKSHVNMADNNQEEYEDKTVSGMENIKVSYGTEYRQDNSRCNYYSDNTEYKKQCSENKNIRDDLESGNLKREDLKREAENEYNKPEENSYGNRQNIGETVLLSDYLKNCEKHNNVNTLILKKDNESIQIDEFPCIIGSMKEYCMKVIENRLISRMHICILSKNNSIYMQDMNSTNGTYLNDIRLVPGEEKIIKNGDVIKLAADSYTVEIH